MKAIIILSIITLIGVNLFSQNNLILDGSFDDYYECPKEEKRDYPLKSWDRINVFNSTTYRNKNYRGCLDSDYYYPNQFKNDPFTEPYSGNGYIVMYPCCLNLKKVHGMCALGYIEPTIGRFESTLEKDSTYYVSIAVQVPVTSSHNLRSMSLVFMKDSIYDSYHSYDFIKLWKEMKDKKIGVVEFDISSTIRNRSKWVVFESTYTASGHENFIFIGFYPEFSEEQNKFYMELIEKEKKHKFYKILRNCYTLRRKKADKSNFLDATIFIDDIKVVVYQNEE